MAVELDTRKQRSIRLYDSTYDRLVVYAGAHHDGKIADAAEALLIQGLDAADGQATLQAQERQAEQGEPVLARILKNVLATELEARLPHRQLDRIEVNAGASHMMVGDLMRMHYAAPAACPYCAGQQPGATTFAHQQQQGALKAATRAVAEGELPRLPK